MAFAEPFVLPGPAVATLGDPDLRFVLHTLGLSHYNARARWTLDVAGIQFQESRMLPLAHIPLLIGVLKRFPPALRSAPSRGASPLGTPCLAIVSGNDEPVCLLSDSGLISRYAVLRAAAVGQRCPPLYGERFAELGIAAAKLRQQEDLVLHVDDPVYRAIEEVEARAALGPLGVEVRRVAYYYILPRPKLSLPLFRNNTSGVQARLAPLIWLLNRMSLLTTMNANAATVARGIITLRSEFDYFDRLLTESGAVAADDAADAGAGAWRVADGRFLVGGGLSGADVALAALASTLVGVTAADGMRVCWYPDILDPSLGAPQPLVELVRELRGRPTGAYVLHMYRTQQAPLAAEQ